MDGEILHSGFDGLRFTIQQDIPPQLRATLAEAKEHAQETGTDYALRFSGITLYVRSGGGKGFRADTGEFGAIWSFQDPETRVPNHPGIEVDFRAYCLATGGIDAAERHFRECMISFGIPYVETQLRVSRVDFAVDICAPWFSPNSEALITPPGTKGEERHGLDAGTINVNGRRVTGLRFGAIENRQIAIYDKRDEVLQQKKSFWPLKWNANRAEAGLPPLDLSDADISRVWRFELRLGSKQLRRRFEIRSWDDLRSRAGNAFSDALKRIRYCQRGPDSNRSRWVTHPLWMSVQHVIQNDMLIYTSNVTPQEAIIVNLASKQRELDAQIRGLLATRAGISGVSEEEFPNFAESHIHSLLKQAQETGWSPSSGILRAKAKYRLND